MGKFDKVYLVGIVLVFLFALLVTVILAMAGRIDWSTAAMMPGLYALIAWIMIAILVLKMVLLDE